MTHARVGRTATGEAGFTLIELLLVVAIVGTLASIAVPGLTRAKAAANESSAIGSSRTIFEGQVTYSTVCGQGFYAETLNQLANGQFVPAELMTGVKSGYGVALTFGQNSLMGPADCDGGPSTTEYYWTATPLSGATGTRSFATNEVGTIWQDTTGVTIVEPLGSGAEVPIQ
jgi:prepilin-type N-terminal cleavage/methylation domain-containing protein